MITATQQPLLLSPFTPEDMGQLQVHLPALKIFSFRGPGQTGGVASSLAPLTKQLGTKVQWVALTGVPSANEKPIAGFSFHRPELSDDIVSQYSKAASNYLWPLLHGMPERAQFDAEEWKNFRQLSLMMAHQSQKISSRSFPTLFWLHDYEMVLLAPMLAMDAGVILTHFWHVPWPAAQIMAASPVGLELCESLLSNRVLGFHTVEYAKNFVESVRLLIPDAQIDAETQTVRYRGNSTRIVAMPLGLDYPYWQRLARSSRAMVEAIPVTNRLAHQIILGVDRMDYSKGILEKLQGLDLFLQNNPDYHRRMHYVQLAQPGFITNPSDDYASKVRSKVAEINAKFRLDGWEPIVFKEGNFEHSQLAAWYQVADVLAVTPVRDGLNLIAKEFIACRQDELGTLVLGEKAGCASELVSGALLVDAASPESIAEGLQQGLSMGVEEKRRRMT
ncbi:MAG: trehalose-6-phosphate synthase, partial [Candidatus Obscuribacterales bacterium]|nr:trehalose-6-phosphate synthase [Candidatus Obscuribacterales bacterium]